MSGNRQLFKSIFISGLAAVISYLINYFLTSYITANVGIEAYGFVSMAKTAVSYAQIITISLTTFTVRFIAVSYHEKKTEEAQGYFTSTVVASAVLSAAIFLAALVVIRRLEYFLNIPEELVDSVKLLFVIVFLNFIVSTVTTPFSSAAFIKNRLDITGIVKIISYCCDAATLVIMFRCFTPAVWFVGVGSLSASMVNLIGNAGMTRRLTPDMRFQRKLFSLRKIKTIFSHGIYNSINSLGNVLNSGLDLIVSNLLLSAVATGQIAVVKTLGAIFSTVNATVFQPMQPKLIESYSDGDINDFMRELKKAMRIGGMFVSLAFAGFFALGLLYYELWLPGEDSVLLYRLTVVTVLVYLMDGIMQPVYYINTLTLKNKIPCFLTILSGLANVLAMYLLLQNTNLGAYAVVGTTTVLMVGLNLTFHTLYGAWVLKVSPKPLYGVIGKHLGATLLLTVVFRLLSFLVQPQGWPGLVALAVVMCVAGPILYALVVFTGSELSGMIGRIKSRFR